MSSGKIHSAVTVGSAAGLISGTLLGHFSKDPVSIAITFFSVLMGVFVGPDQDVDGGNISDYYMRRIYMDRPWGLFWKPYRIGLQHRSFLSHFPVISTFIRVIYIFFPLTIVFIQNQQSNPLRVLFPALISQIFSIPLLFGAWWYWHYVLEYWPFVIVGLIVPDTLHWIFDR